MSELFPQRYKSTYVCNTNIDEVPKNLVIPSCSLQLSEPVGQGIICISVFLMHGYRWLCIIIIIHIIMCRGVWNCVQSQVIQRVQQEIE